MIQSKFVKFVFVQMQKFHAFQSIFKRLLTSPVKRFLDTMILDHRVQKPFMFGDFFLQFSVILFICTVLY